MAVRRSAYFAAQFLNARIMSIFDIRILAMVTTVAALMPLASPAFADDCGILSLAQVSEALPDYQPWVLLSGGTGSCHFEGEVRLEGGSFTQVTFRLTQQFKPSKQDATKQMQTLRQELAKSYTLKPLTLRGAEPGAFTYSSDTRGKSLPGFWWFAQIGSAILSGIYLLPGQMQLDEEEEATVLSLLEKAVADTANPATAAKASRCPHFDEALIRKLIPGKKVTIEQYGVNSCLAKNENNAIVMFSRIADVDEATMAQIARSSASGCTAELIPALGEYGQIAHHCTMGNKNAAVEFYKDHARFSYSLIPKGEPTAQQRADLIKLARRRYQE